MAIVYLFVAAFVLTMFFVWRGSKTNYLEKDVVSIPHEENSWASLSQAEIEEIVYKVNLYDAMYKIVYFREADGTEGVYHMTKKNDMVAFSTGFDRVSLVKQNNNNGGNGNNGK